MHRAAHSRTTGEMSSYSHSNKTGSVRNLGYYAVSWPEVTEGPVDILRPRENPKTLHLRNAADIRVDSPANFRVLTWTEGVVQIRVTPKTRIPFTIRALSISGVTWKWHFLNHAQIAALSWLLPVRAQRAPTRQSPTRRAHRRPSCVTEAWFKICPFRVTQACENRRPVRVGQRLAVFRVGGGQPPRVKLAGAEAVPGPARSASADGLGRSSTPAGSCPGARHAGCA